MAIDEMAFDPATGLLDTATYPTNPESETAARTQVQAGMNQLRDYINDTLLAALAAVTDGAAGADNVGMTAITETGSAATVQAVIEALITKLKAVTDSASGADLVGMTAITETGAAATVQSIIEALITRLKAVTDGASGADLVAMTAISGWAGATVQAIMEAAKTDVDGKAVKSLLTTAGDMPYATGASTWARLAAVNDKFLKMVAGVPTWSDPSSRVASGTYTGDVSTARTITVGFAPKHVILVEDASTVTLWNIYSTSYSVLDGSTTRQTYPKLAATGFVVDQNSGNRGSTAFAWAAIG